MRYGIHYGYWAKDWIDDCVPLIKKCSELGFSVMELGGSAFANFAAQKLDVLRAASSEYGVELTAGIGCGVQANLASLDPNIQQAGISYLKRAILNAERAGIHTIAGILYASWFYDAHKPVHKVETTRNSVLNMKQIADFASDHGVSLMMEVCNRFATYMLNTAQEAVEYVDAVDRDNVYVMLDTFHMNIEENSFADAIRFVGSRLGYIHLAENNRRVPGTSHLPWQEIIHALQDISFTGPAVFECFVNRDCVVGHDLKTWRNLYDDVSEPQKDLSLIQSLNYLKRFEVK